MEKFSLDRDWKFHNGDISVPRINSHTESYMAAKAGGAIGAAFRENATGRIRKKIFRRALRRAGERERHSRKLSQKKHGQQYGIRLHRERRGGEIRLSSL